MYRFNLRRLARASRRRAGGRGLALVLSAGILALTIGGAAIAQQNDNGDGQDNQARSNPLLLGVENGTGANPVPEETTLFSNSADWSLRQSNLSSTGGSGIYGCRGGPPPADAGQPGPNPCLRANNLRNGEAFQFQATNGNVGGRIQVGGANLAQVNPNGVPFQTNASGLVNNLNADEVDGLDAAQLRGQQGPTGPQGPQGQQGPQGEQGPAGVAGFYKVAVVAPDIPPGAAPIIVADCEEGDIATGGGYDIAPEDPDATVHTAGDSPVDNPDGVAEPPIGWAVQVVNDGPGRITLRVEAICVEASA